MTRLRIAMVSVPASPLAVLDDRGGDPGGADLDGADLDSGVGSQHVHVAGLAAALAGRGHQATVYTRRDSPQAPDRVSVADRFTVEHVPAGPARALPEDALLPHMGGFGRWLADRWSTEEAPDVVHAHFWTSGLAALTATADLRMPVVVTFHALGTVERRHRTDRGVPNRLGLERTLGQLADRVVARSAQEIDDLTRMGVHRPRITLVPSGVDIGCFTPDGPAMPRGEARWRILSVGRLAERKGHDAVIRALRQVPGAEVVIAGGPPPGRLDGDPDVRRLRAVAGQSGVGDRVRILGAVPHTEMPAWYRSADVLCCAPWYEPFGLAPLEAMACGVPVITYAVGGPAESVIDGVTGRHVPTGDVRALGAALRGLLCDDVQRMSYSSAAVDRVRSRYTWERVAQDTERVYAVTTGSAVGAGSLPEMSG